MVDVGVSSKSNQVLLEDAIHRDLTTARRAALLHILWNERYLTRAQLLVRVKLRLGRNCFGRSAWEDAFYRDMRVVKWAFQAAGYQVLYSRRKEQPGYYLRGQPALLTAFQQMVKSSAAEADPWQIGIYRSLSPAARFRQGSGLSSTALNVVAYRIRQEHPELTAEESIRTALQRAYRP